MKHMKMIAILSALLAVCTLTSCGQGKEDETQNTTTPQETTTETPEIETPICTEEYVDPSTTTTPAAQSQDYFFYSNSILPDYTVRNPVRYLNEDKTFGGFDGWQYFGDYGELCTVPQPQRSTYTYQMYAYYLRTDLSDMYADNGLSLPSHVEEIAEHIADTSSNGNRLLWYSMEQKLPENIMLNSAQWLDNSDGTQQLLRACYTVTVGNVNTSWFLYFIPRSDTADVFAVRVNENPDAVMSFTDSIVRSYRHVQDDIFYYQYAADLGNYSCIYITPEQTAVWNTQTKPDFDTPEQSVGFSSAYTATTDTEQYRQFISAMIRYFSEIADRKVNDTITEYDVNEATMNDPLEAMWLYSDGKAYAHRKLHSNSVLLTRLLHQIGDDAVNRAAPPTPTADEPTVIAVLWLRHGAYAPHNLARYYANGTMTQWGYKSGTPDLSAPLKSPEMIDKEEHSIGALPDFPYMNGMLMRYEHAGVMVPTDLGYAITLFYLEDGSIRVTSSYNWGGTYTVWDEINTTLSALQQTQ